MRRKLIFNERFIQLFLLLIIITSLFKFYLSYLDLDAIYFYVNSRFLCSLYFISLLYFHYINQDIYLDTHVRVRLSKFKKDYYLSEIVLVLVYAVLVALVIYTSIFIGQSHFFSMRLVYNIVYTVLLYGAIIQMIHIFNFFIKRRTIYLIIFVVLFVLSFSDFIFPSLTSLFIVFMNVPETISYRLFYILITFGLNLFEFIVVYLILKRKGDFYE